MAHRPPHGLRPFAGASLSCLACGLPSGAVDSSRRQTSPPNHRVRVIIHADDAGMCHSANAATMAALESGGVTSASVMVPCPWFPEMAAWARRRPDADLGVHLTLTSEWNAYRWGPAASKKDVPGLVDAGGYLRRSVEAVVRHARAEEVETELRAQIEKALAAGLRPTHLDTHMGTVYARDDFFRVYLRLSREYGIPCMVLRPGPNAQQIMREHGVNLAPESLEITARLEQPMLDTLVAGVAPQDLTARRAAWCEVLRGLEPGVHQIIVHLARNTEEIHQITGHWRVRWNDFRIFTDSAMRGFLAKQGIEPATWRALAEAGGG